jgi:hypothetical protein
MLKIDNQVQRRLEECIHMFGIRPVLNALAAATDTMAIVAGDNFNTTQAKQWAAWSVALEALADDRKLSEPGREFRVKPGQRP